MARYKPQDHNSLLLPAKQSESDSNTVQLDAFFTRMTV